jgi:hypothetical protein
VLAVLSAGAAVVFANGNFTGQGALVNAPIDIHLNNATAADVHVDLGLGNLTIGSISRDGKLLATCDLGYFANQGVPIHEVTESGNVASVLITERPGGWNFASNWFNGGSSPNWEISLNERVPLDLEVDSGTGNTTLDLERLQLGRLKVDTGAGNASITLPSAPGNTTVDIDGGTGNLELIVPQGVEARIEVDSGIGNTNVESRFSKQDDDTYESSGYSTATNKLTIQVDHGIGSLDIRSK